MIRYALATLAIALTGALLVSTSFADEKHASHDKTAKVGDRAPNFELTDQNGNAVSLDQYKGQLVVLEWFNNECPFVQKQYKNGDMNKLASKYKEKGVVWLAIDSTKSHDSDQNKEIAQKWNIDRPILSDASGKVGHLYDAKTTPHMYIIDKDGTLAYAGAIDSIRSSDPADVAKADNYVAKALDQLLAGESVSTKETKSYGCSVKY